MRENIKKTPLAEESFGTRSICTHIETKDINILVDPGVSLAPKRQGYPPHPREYQALRECCERIEKIAEKA